MVHTKKPEPVQDEWQALSKDDAWHQVGNIITPIHNVWDPPPDSERPFDFLTYKNRTFLLVAYLETEVMNGGYNQWFHNPTGAFVAEARVAARDMGMDYLADLIRDAEVEYFSQHYAGLPDTTRVDSLEQFDLQYEAWRPDILRHMLRWWHTTDENGKTLSTTQS